MANKSRKAKGDDCRTKRSAGSQQRVVGLRGTVRCVRCGYPQHDMPLDRLDEYACGKYDMKAGQPCGGGYVVVKKRKQPNDQALRPRTPGLPSEPDVTD